MLFVSLVVIVPSTVLCLLAVTSEWPKIVKIFSSHSQKECKQAKHDKRWNFFHIPITILRALSAISTPKQSSLHQCNHWMLPISCSWSLACGRVDTWVAVTSLSSHLLTRQQNHRKWSKRRPSFSFLWVPKPPSFSCTRYKRPVLARKSQPRVELMHLLLSFLFICRHRT